MPPISRGFHRRRPSADPARVPPGQYVTHDFPVLSAGPTPQHAARRTGASRSAARSTSRAPGPGRSFAALPQRDGHGRHPLRHQVVEARHGLDGRLARHAARRRRDERRATSLACLRRRLHDQPAAGGPDRRQGVGRLRVRRRAARARARRPGAAARAAPLLLEEREVGARPRAARARTSRASGRATATTTTATRGKSSATRATEPGSSPTVVELVRRDGARHARIVARRCPTGPGTAPASTSTCA